MSLSLISDITSLAGGSALRGDTEYSKRGAVCPIWEVGLYQMGRGHIRI